MKKLSFLLFVVLCVLAVQSCQKETVEDPELAVAPNLPELASFVMPFSAFEDLDTNGIYGAVKEEKSTFTYQNWFHAGVSLLAWNVVLGVNMAIPVASFAEAFNHDPENVGLGAFRWSYDVNVGNEVFNASLTAEYQNLTEIAWTMTVSREGGFQDFVYYTGVTSIDRSSATWFLNHQPWDPEPFLTIDYQKDLASDDLFIRYTNVIPGNEGNGEYIEYRVNADAMFNRAYDVFRGTEDFLEIQWDEPSRAGRVKHFKRFEDNDWHCWDAELMDTDC